MDSVERTPVLGKYSIDSSSNIKKATALKHVRWWAGVRESLENNYGVVLVSLCTEEVEEVQGQPGLHSETLPHNYPPTKKFCFAITCSIEEDVVLKIQISLTLEGKWWIGLCMISFRMSNMMMVSLSFSSQDTEAEGLQEFEASLGYIVNSRLGRTKLWLKHNKPQNNYKIPKLKKNAKKKVFGIP